MTGEERRKKKGKIESLEKTIECLEEKKEKVESLEKTLECLEKAWRKQLNVSRKKGGRRRGK